VKNQGCTRAQTHDNASALCPSTLVLQAEGLKESIGSSVPAKQKKKIATIRKLKNRANFHSAPCPRSFTLYRHLCQDKKNDKAGEWRHIVALKGLTNWSAFVGHL